MTVHAPPLPRADRLVRNASSRLPAGLRTILDAAPVDRRKDTPWVIRIAAGAMAVFFLARDPWIGQLTNIDPGVAHSLAQTGPAQFVTFLLTVGVALSWWLPGLALLLVGGTLAVASLLASLAVAPMVVGDVTTLPVTFALASWPWWWHVVMPGTRFLTARRLLDEHQRLWVMPTLALTALVFVYARGVGPEWGSADNWRMDTWTSLLLLVPVLAVLMPRLALITAVLVIAASAAPLTAPQYLMNEPQQFHAWPFVATLVLVMVGAVSRHRHAWVAIVALGTAVLLHLALFLGWGAMYAGDVKAVEVHREWAGETAVRSLGLDLWPTYLVHLIVLLACLFIGWHISQTVAMRQRSHVLATRETQMGERARLARDLHDVIAHHVSLIAVRAETAPWTHPTLDASGRELLADIAGDARRTLDELRGVLGVLRRSDLESGPQAGQTVPLPGGNDLLTLVERNQAAGMQVTMADMRGAYAEVGYTSGRGNVMYRVLQEALTNARRHAPRQPVLVVLADFAPQLVVSNPVDGPGSDEGMGSGLVGMRERVEALGGRVTVVRDGEFRIEVSFDD